MNNRVLSVAVILSSLTLACGHPEATLSPETPGKSLSVVRLRAEPYSFAYVSGLNTPERIVVRDAASWQTLWARINAPLLPVPPVPAADFSQEMLVVVALGARSSGGYTILVDGASVAEDGSTSVAVRSISPKNCVTTAAFTQPVDIARMPRREGNVSFVEQSEVHTCQ
jgi:hypothetical protein